VTDVSVETPTDRLTSYITSNEDFFVRHHSPAEAPDPDSWRLSVEGEVARPFQLSLDELRRLPPTTVTCVLECAGNGRSLYQPSVQGLSWGRGAVGNARWTGVRVNDLLERAGLKAGARHLHTAGTDEPPAGEAPFLRSVELEKALADAIVAWQMNGEPLPALHGAPARLVVPGWAGDHWMKWLARLSPQAGERTGYFMEEEYRFPLRPGAPGVSIDPAEMRPITNLFVKSIITTAPPAARVGVPVEVSGFAFSGAPDVSRVEISDDDGSTWTAADLDPRHDPYAWRLWSFRWTPKRPGPIRVSARATDSRGSVQPREAVWNPGGFLHNGWHSIEVMVAEQAVR
jgi:DMSO/TMAO reductase YedYZ molybdopterin-dependent catalytic subunit